MTASLLGDVFVEIIHETAIITERPCPVVLIQAAGVCPGIDKVNFAFAALAADNDRKHIFIIHSQKFIIFRRIGKFQFAQRSRNDPETACQYHTHGVWLVVKSVTGRPVETAPLLCDLQTAEFTEVALIHKIFQFEGVMTACYIFGEVGDADTKFAARLNIFTKDFVLFVRTGVPAGEDQDLVVVDQKVGSNIVIGKADNVRLTIRRGTEMQIFVRIEHGLRTGEQHIFQNLESGFRRTRYPVGIVFRHIVRRSDRTIHGGADPGEVKIPFGDTNDRFRLTGRGGIFFGIVVEIGNDLAVFRSDRRTVADVREEFFRRRHQTCLEFIGQSTARSGIAETVAATGHSVHGRVFAEGGLQAPVAAFVDDHLRTRHVLEEHGCLQGFHLVWILVGQIRIPFVRQMGSPDRQIVRTEQTAVHGRCSGQVAKGKVFRTGHFHTRRHLVVNIEIGAGRHDKPPILFMAVIHPRLDFAHKKIGSIPQTHVLGFLFRHFRAVAESIDAPEDPH